MTASELHAKYHGPPVRSSDLLCGGGTRKKIRVRAAS
jgi:hypothetical protein